MRRLLALFALVLAAGPAAGQDLASFERKTTVHVLANGWTFILVRRPVAPVFSFTTIANVGSAQEVPGITGLAHMFEHMAFKGSPDLGSTDWPAEEKALAEVERAYQAWQAERLSRRPDEKRLEALRADFTARQQEAARFAVKGAFAAAVEREGGVGLNASTDADGTGYFCSLPANKLELFALLESERFRRPVLRGFYEERDVVREERRTSIETRALGRLLEQVYAAAFTAHPYRHPTLGAKSDLESFTRTDAERFFAAHYPPANLVTAIVGDVDPAAAIPLLEKYFGRIPARPAAPPLVTVEPPQIAEKRIVMREGSSPLYLEAYHKPAMTHPDQAVYDVIDDILTVGRTARLHRALVRDEQLAVRVQASTKLPGERYPSLFVVIAVPAKGASSARVEQALRREIERLKTEEVTAEELARAKTRAKAELLRSLAGNQGLATQLADHQRLFGDWRELFRALDRLEAVTAADVRRVASETFREANRTVAMIVPPGS